MKVVREYQITVILNYLTPEYLDDHMDYTVLGFNHSEHGVPN